jgi:hypothetical protein
MPLAINTRRRTEDFSTTHHFFDQEIENQLQQIEISIGYGPVPDVENIRLLS